MSKLPKLVTTNLDSNSYQKGEQTPSTLLQSPVTPSNNGHNRPPFTGTEKSREKTKFKGVIDKFMGNFNGKIYLNVKFTIEKITEISK